MISFESDYNNGMLPEILEALGKTNGDKTSGYGFDPYSESAKENVFDKRVLLQNISHPTTT